MAADIAAYALSLGRELAADLMPDTCQITRGSGDPVTNPDTGEVTTTPNAVYAGPCRVQSWAAQESSPEVATGVRTLQRYTVSVPIAASVSDYAPQTGDDVTILAAEFDPHLAGRTFQVSALLHKSHATAYRLAVEEGS